MLLYVSTKEHDVYALVAQLDRVFDYESKGREFESLRAHHEKLLSVRQELFHFGSVTNVGVAYTKNCAAASPLSVTAAPCQLSQGESHAPDGAVRWYRTDESSN